MPARFYVNSGTVTQPRFVKAIVGSNLTVEQAVLGDAVFGIALQDGDAALSETVVVDQSLTAGIVESGEALADGAQLMSDADGRAALWDEDPDHVIVGVSVGTTTGAGEFVGVDVSATGWSQSFESAPYAATFRADNDLTHVTAVALADQMLPLSVVYTESQAPSPIGTWITDSADPTLVRFPIPGLYAFAVETFSANNDNALGVIVSKWDGSTSTPLATCYAPASVTGSDFISASSGGWVPITAIGGTSLANDAVQLRATYPDSAASTYDGSPVYLRIWRVGDLPTA